MPCLAIHLAVAKKYLEKHKEENHDEFILGTIAPDIFLPNINQYIKGVSEDKNSHHFGTNYKTESLTEYMKKKVDFNLFFDSNDINTSFLRAYFLHLLCDYYFFGEYISNNKLEGLSFDEAVRIGINDYDLITPSIIEKYSLDIPDQIKDTISKKGEGNLQLLDEDTVYNFIDEMSNVDLYKEKKKVKSNKQNVKRFVYENARWIILFISVICLLFLIEDVMDEDIMSFDEKGYSIVSEHLMSDSMTSAEKCITNFGSAYWLIGLSAVFLFVLSNKKIAFSIFVNLGLAALVNHTLKYILQRPRPIEHRIIDESRI